MEARSIEKYLFDCRARSLLREMVYVKETRIKEGADYVAFLKMAIQIAQKFLFAFIKNQSMERIVSQQFPDILACGMDQMRPFFCSGWSQSFSVAV